MKKSTYEVVKMAVKAGIDYDRAVSDLQHTEIGTNAVVEPKSKKTEDIVAASNKNLSAYYNSKINHTNAVMDVEIAKAKINTLLWFVSEDEFIEDADI